jgi:hypothetical protein
MLGASLLLACCGCGAEPGASRVAVQGRATIDGTPLSSVMIVFRCGQGDNQVTAFGLVENGYYQIEAENGPLPGKARVEFQPKPIERSEFESLLDQSGWSRQHPKLTVVDIPPQFGSASVLTADVAKDGENKIDFDLKSRS